MTDPQSKFLWETRPRDVFWGERLQIAREFRGLTQKELSEAVSASPALVSLCESGKKNPSSRDLIEAFGDVLGFDPDFFYGEFRDVFREEQCSFRHRRATPERMKNKIRAHATLLGLVITRLKSLFRFPEINIPRFEADSLEGIELAAENCRKHWQLREGPILEVGRVLEHAGVFIVSQLCDVQKVDAFSRYGPTCVIALNQHIKSTSRWHFDIGHECGHLVLHQGIATGSEETEAAADRFSGAFLMPRKPFSRDFRSRGASFWQHIFALKRRWRTSAAAIVRRGYELNLLSAVEYRKAYKHMAWKKWSANGEPEEPTFQQPELLPDALKALGDKVDLTLEGLRQELHFKTETFAEVTGIRIPTQQGKPKTIPFTNYN